MRNIKLWTLLLFLGTGLVWGCAPSTTPPTNTPTTEPSLTASLTDTSTPTPVETAALKPGATQTPASAKALIALPSATPSSSYEITADDNGKTFSYGITSRFTVILDESKYPKKNLACSPDGIVGSISNIPSVKPPLYAARFEAVTAGTCLLKDGDFSVTILITP